MRFDRTELMKDLNRATIFNRASCATLQRKDVKNRENEPKIYPFSRDIREVYIRWATMS
jgi:hypothetical protein